MGKKRYELDIERYGADVLDSEELQHAFQQTHHTWSTVGEHTLRVAAASLIICYALRKIHVRTDISAVVKGALCHDLGILGRDEIARRLVEDLPEKSADIIERHMWPAGHSKMPNSLEGVIVSTADKYAAVKDLICGSEIKHTGIRNTIRSCFDRTSQLTR